MMRNFDLDRMSGLMVPRRQLHGPSREHPSIGCCGPTFFGGGAPDPNFGNVVLLMHMDGSNGSTTFTDSSSHNHTFSIGGGTPTISTQAEAFGGAEFSWSSDYPSYIESSGSNFLANSTSSWTIEFFVNITVNTNPGGYSDGRHTILNLLSASSSVLVIAGSYASGTGFAYSTVSQGAINISGSDLNIRRHIAIVKNVPASETYTYLDGSRTNIIPSIPTLNFDTIRIGSSSNNTRRVGGFLEELRITDGIPRYTGTSFTVPTGAYPNN